MFKDSPTSNSSTSVTFLTISDSVFEGEEVFLVNFTTDDSDVGTAADQGLVLIQDQTSERGREKGGRGSCGLG